MIKIIIETIETIERKWYHKLFGINKPKPVTGLTLKDFILKEYESTTEVINSLEELNDGVYVFELKRNV